MVLLGLCVCVCVLVCVCVCVCRETSECRPTPYTHSTKNKLMDEQMNRRLNQWMDEELERAQDRRCSYVTVKKQQK